jgi:NhaP-type Na+/H+ or K+/H+ antiporter
MYVLEHMQMFEAISIGIGLITGITGASLPSAFDEKRPQGSVWAFSLAVGAFVGILSIAAEGHRFFGILAMTLAAVVVGWVGMAFLRRSETPTAAKSQPVLPSKKEQPVTAHKAA